MSQGSVSERLRMGSAANVSQQLRRGRDGAAQVNMSAKLKRLINKSRIVACPLLPIQPHYYSKLEFLNQIGKVAFSRRSWNHCLTTKQFQRGR